MPDLKSSPPLQKVVMGVNFLKKESFGILKSSQSGYYAPLLFMHFYNLGRSHFDIPAVYLTYDTCCQ